jgi:succinate dehydrogenase flavin-adding protein (antitoxin of CptAB toxin-antitoxin module)
MRELDMLLMAYADGVFPDASAEHQQAFEQLLTLQDPEIHALLTGRSQAQDPALRDVVQRLLRHS